MIDPEVVNIHFERCDVFVGRGSPWGNPFHIGRDGPRDVVINKYRRWIQQRPQLITILIEYIKNKGNRLGCHCAPSPCHGDILVEEIRKVL